MNSGDAGKGQPGTAAEPARRVLVVDDDPLSRSALRSLLDTIPNVIVVGESSQASEAAQRVDSLQPDVVLIDIQMAGPNGLELTRSLVQRHPDLKVLMVSVLPEDPFAVEALKAGALGYLHKRDAGTHLEQALARVALGEVYLAPSVAPKLVRRLVHERVQGPSGQGLTPREREVLKLLAAGRSNKEIATALNVTPRTVKAHVSRILHKLHLDDRFQAALYALRSGIAPDPDAAAPPTEGVASRGGRSTEP
ncbi:response regulator transcription factor [Carboxydochorda subterranea]|uniref:Response regulator transcription factor n=1 Tax=Carboxydichorda subterranea TaxID=3109565 RepID=A0ABZ1BY68_9FIRM|nr:response regulator transcription factor [Limnochorda sp. L945t]WRP17465.1 response regulator transcription factor [Limnochorda sp. L945t]